MQEIQPIRTISFAEVFGYRIFLPVTKSPRSSERLGEMIGAVIAGCRNLTEVTTRICGLGCILMYKPRARCFVMRPNRDSLLENKIREFETWDQAECRSGNNHVRPE